MSNIHLVTGANGFVGCALVRRISERSAMERDRPSVRAAVRHLPCRAGSRIDCVAVGDIDRNTDWQRVLSDVAVVIHAAARAHVLDDDSEKPLDAFRSVNVDGTVNLARQAVQAGVHRFVLISSVGVNGNETFARPFTATDAPNPQEPYAVSKHEAEVALQRLLSGTRTQLVIVRPPLVYGPGAPGNFARLLGIAASPWPLPLGSIHNRRSFVALDNLLDLIMTCCDHPLAASQTFLVSDGEDLSTTELLVRLARALNRPARLFPLPVWMIVGGAALLGNRDLSRRLCGNLQLDISKTRELLGWAPPVSVDEGLRRATAEMRVP